MIYYLVLYLLCFPFAKAAETPTEVCEDAFRSHGAISVVNDGIRYIQDIYAILLTQFTPNELFMILCVTAIVGYMGKMTDGTGEEIVNITASKRASSH